MCSSHNRRSRQLHSRWCHAPGQDSNGGTRTECQHVPVSLPGLGVRSDASPSSLLFLGKRRHRQTKVTPVAQLAVVEGGAEHPPPSSQLRVLRHSCRALRVCRVRCREHRPRLRAAWDAVAGRWDTCGERPLAGPISGRVNDQRLRSPGDTKGTACQRIKPRKVLNKYELK